jgi:RNA polymerase sigma factor (sigma-70 family)
MVVMEPAELGRVVEEHAAALALYARQWCAAPEDIVQEAFLKLVAQAHAPNQPVAWLYRVVRNAAISAARAGQRRRKHEGIAAERSASWFLPSEGKDLDSQLATHALQALPDEEREAITLHLWGGLTFLEIADVLGCTHSTAHRWYAAGLDRLRERLDTPCPGSKIQN